MPCRSQTAADGVDVIACTRGGGRCRNCGDAGATHRCEHPLKGRLAGKQCSRRLCERCTIVLDDGRELCPPHARYVGAIR